MSHTGAPCARPVPAGLPAPRPSAEPTRPRRRAAAALTALLLALLGVVAAAPGPARAAGGGSLTGVVRAPGGAPVGSYEVCVTANSDATLDGGFGSAATDADGRFVIEDLPAGYYRVMFQDCRYQPAAAFATRYFDGKGTYSTADLVAVRNGEQTPGVDTTMVAGTSISGTVTANDTALAGVCVDAAVPSANGGRTIVDSTATDADGRYALTRLAPDTDYRVAFRPCSPDSPYRGEWYDDATDFATARTVRPTADEPATGIDAALATGSSISGTIRDADGPVRGDVCASASRPDGSAPQGGSVLADEHGAYRIQGLDAGSYLVYFYDCRPDSDRNDVPQYYEGAATREKATLVVVGDGGAKTGIDATMRPGVRIAGTVTAAKDDAPLGRICVEATPANPGPGDDWTSGHAETAPDGTYALGQIPERAGGYVVRFRDCGARPTFVTQFAGGDWRTGTPVSPTIGTPAVGVDGRLVRGATIRGRITDPDGPVDRGVCVAATRKPDPDDPAPGPGVAVPGDSATVAADGTYALGALPAGRYDVSASDCGDTSRNDVAALRADAATLAAGATAEGVDLFMRRATTISGTAYEGSDSDDPLAQVCVNALLVDPGEDTYTYTGSFADTGADGRYTLRHIDPEQAYTVAFSDCSNRGLAMQYFDRQPTQEDATVLRPTVEAPATGIDAHLLPAAVRITSGPAADATTNARSARFGFAADGAFVRFECALDGAAYAPCDGPYRADDLADGQHTFAVRVAGGDGAPVTRTWTVRASSPNSTAQGSVRGGEELASDPGATPSVATPVLGTVRLPQAGTVTLTKEPVTTPSTNGYAIVGQQFDITAEKADGSGVLSGTAAAPIRLTFSVARSAIPAGTGMLRLAVLRNGRPAEDCSGPVGSAIPDPCVFGRSDDGDAVTITVLTTHLSVWNLAVTPEPTSGGGNPGGGNPGGGSPGGGTPGGGSPGGGTPGGGAPGGAAPGAGSTPGGAGGSGNGSGAPSPAPGVPATPPAGSGATPAPTATLGRIARTTVAKALRGGLRLPVTCSSACRLTAVATVDGRTARRLRLAKRATPTTVASGAGSATARSGGVVLRFTAKAKRALRRQPSLKLAVVVTVKGADGASRRVVRTIAVRR